MQRMGNDSYWPARESDASAARVGCISDKYLKVESDGWMALGKLMKVVTRRDRVSEMLSSLSSIERRRVKIGKKLTPRIVKAMAALVFA
jgi:hypothetical protein